MTRIKDQSLMGDNAIGRVERDYTRELVEIGQIAVSAMQDNEGVPVHIVAVVIATRIVEKFPDIALDRLSPDLET